MNVDRSAVESTLGRDRIESITKLVLAVASVLFVAYLASFVPGTEHLVPTAGIDGGIVVGSLLTIVVVGLLVYLSSALARLLELVLEGPPVLVESVASIVRWLVLLLTVIVAHIGLSPLAAAVLGSMQWAFDIAALFVAVPILLAISLRLYVSLDPASRYLTDAVAGRTR